MFPFNPIDHLLCLGIFLNVFLFIYVRDVFRIFLNFSILIIQIFFVIMRLDVPFLGLFFLLAYAPVFAILLVFCTTVQEKKEHFPMSISSSLWDKKGRVFILILLIIEGGFVLFYKKPSLVLETLPLKGPYTSQNLSKNILCVEDPILLLFLGILLFSILFGTISILGPSKTKTDQPKFLNKILALRKKILLKEISGAQDPINEVQDPLGKGNDL